jgi:hypothetical protein
VRPAGGDAEALGTVEFEPGRARLKPQELEELARVAEALVCEMTGCSASYAYGNGGRSKRRGAMHPVFAAALMESSVDMRNVRQAKA